MKPTQEQVIAWYEQANGWSPEGCDKTVQELERFAALAYEAGRKDERERILDMCKEGLWDGAGIKFHLDKQGENNEQT